MERVAGEVRAVLGEVLARDEIKDPRVRGVGLITVTHVRVSGDLRHARALFTVHDLDETRLNRVREGLDHASGYFRKAIARRLRMKVAPAVTFEVDRVFEQAARVEKLLAETAPPRSAEPEPDKNPPEDEELARRGRSSSARPSPSREVRNPSEGSESDDDE
jgi:ribosome-binding factor A